MQNPHETADLAKRTEELNGIKVRVFFGKKHRKKALVPS